MMLRNLLLTFLLCTTFIIERREASCQVNTDSIATLLDESFNTSMHVDRLNEIIFEAWASTNISDDIIFDAREVLKIAKEINYKKGEADALTNLVRLYLLQYESSKSLEYALGAIKLYEELGDKLNAGYNQMQIGVIYYTSQNFNKSQEYYDKAIRVFTELGEQEKLTTLYYLSGLNNTRLKRYDEALVQFRKSYNFKAENENNQGMAECLTGISELFLELEKPDSTLFYTRRVKELIKNNSSAYGKAKVAIIESRAYKLKGNIEKAQEYSKYALALAENLDARELKIEAYQAIAEVQELSQNYKSAYEWHLKFMSLRDSLFNEKNSMRISQLESAYRIERSESQIEILEKEQRINTILLRGAIVFTILIIILLFVLFNQYKIKQRSNQDLANAYEQLQDTQEQLIHHQKMASMGQLASGIAHEIQNPLNFVNNFAEMSIEMLEELKELNLNDEQKSLINNLLDVNNKIGTHGKRAQNIVKSMQDHSNMKAGSLQITNINTLIHRSLELCLNELKRNHPEFNCRVIRELDPAIPDIKVQLSQLTRVFQNIFNNSFEAMFEKKESGFEPELFIESKASDEHVLIRIRDNGIGISTENIERSFEPFFTTKAAKTGLGLSLSYDIITAHRGELEANSVLGEFTEVTISLPLP